MARKNTNLIKKTEMIEEKNISNKEEITKKVAKKESKKATVKKAVNETKNTVSKEPLKKSKKSTTEKDNKKTTSKITKKATTKKTATKKVIEKINNKSIDILEYYDLPYRYNETIVRLLAQTPNKLFVYWDISDDDRKKYIEKYGEDFFNITVPVLFIHNETLNYTFQVTINDFANSWYIPINDDNCKYKLELGRVFKSISNPHIDNKEEYIHITSSNRIDAPNGHPLIGSWSEIVCFKNIQDNTISNKIIPKNFFSKNSQSVCNFYHEFFKDTDILENNPSSR